mgnify:CR=1 FL=1
MDDSHKTHLNIGNEQNSKAADVEFEDFDGEYDDSSSNSSWLHNMYSDNEDDMDDASISLANNDNNMSLSPQNNNMLLTKINWFLGFLKKIKAILSCGWELNILNLSRFCSYELDYSDVHTPSITDRYRVCAIINTYSRKI